MLLIWPNPAFERDAPKAARPWTARGTHQANGRAGLASLTDQLMLQLATAECAARRETVDLPGLLAMIGQMRQTGLAQTLTRIQSGFARLGSALAT